MKLHPEYIVDESLNKKSVVIPYVEWEGIVEKMEELEDIRAYDRAKRKEEDALLGFDEAVMEIRAEKIS